MPNLLRHIRTFLKSDHNLPLLAGVASGLYPWVFYFTKNFKFVNSWPHFFFFLSRFVLLPTAVYYLLYFMLRDKQLNYYKQRLLPTLSCGVFGYLLLLTLFANIGWKKTIAVIGVALAVYVISKKVNNLMPKLITLQFLLVITASLSVYSLIKQHLKYDSKWLEQPDKIADVRFDIKPNIYVIQPDGYVSFSEIDKGYYNYDNRAFEQWIKDNGFVVYGGFRSNYHSTLTSNSSMFAMKHHYYNLLDERTAILGKNPTLDLLQQNGYTTHFLTEVPYLQANRPKIAYDYSNIDNQSVPFLSKGFSLKRSLLNDFLPLLDGQQGANFYFLEKMNPGHITTYSESGTTPKSERENYLAKLESANDWLREIVPEIEKSDPDALIVLVADHGGFVGWEYAKQTEIQISDDPDKIISIYSSLLAIKWPNNHPPEFDDQLKTSVNLFRILFAHLSDEPKLLRHLQPDRSYIKFSKNSQQGVYEYLNDKREVVFEKIR